MANNSSETSEIRAGAAQSELSSLRALMRRYIDQKMARGTMRHYHNGYRAWIPDGPVSRAETSNPHHSLLAQKLLGRVRKTGTDQDHFELKECWAEGRVQFTYGAGDFRKSKTAPGQNAHYFGFLAVRAQTISYVKAARLPRPRQGRATRTLQYAEVMRRAEVTIPFERGDLIREVQGLIRAGKFRALGALFGRVRRGLA